MPNTPKTTSWGGGKRGSGDRDSGNRGSGNRGERGSGNRGDRGDKGLDRKGSDSSSRGNSPGRCRPFHGLPSAIRHLDAFSLQLHGTTGTGTRGGPRCSHSHCKRHNGGNSNWGSSNRRNRDFRVKGGMGPS